jgi:hypothetical protein
MGYTLQLFAELTQRHAFGPTQELTLRAPELARALVPGQAVLVKCGWGLEPYLRRTFYPIAIDDETWTLRVPPGSDWGHAWLRAAPVGTAIDCLGPVGNGYLVSLGARNVLCIGVAELASMLLPVVALVAEAQGLAAAAVTTGDFTAVLAFVAAQLAAQPERSDVIHDLLADLAEQMIAMNKQKGDKMRGFLTWLERETGARIEDLTGKSQLRDYLGDYQKDEAPLPFDAILAILRKNARKLTVDPGGRKFQESLKKEYEASLAVLLPLKARLAATDRLIDQVVYRLYGLTEDEIAVVEGNEGG